MAVTETALGERGIVLGGQEVRTGETYEIRSPYDGSPVAVVHRAGTGEIERAIAGAVEAFEVTRHLAAWQRNDRAEAADLQLEGRCVTRKESRTQHW